jgi:threonylcarbamoyladenosine tRNA methylthiotransferase MtaB
MKFRIITLGCKVNHFESEAIAQAMKSNGHQEMCMSENGKETVELCIINTCSVTQNAGMQSRQAIRKAIREHPNARVAVTGCHAQLNAAEISAIRGIDFVVGHADKHRLHELAEPMNADFPPVLCREVTRQNRFQPMPDLPMKSRTRAFLKIQDGCSSFCSYCVVPLARGPSRSLEPGRILESLRSYQCEGFKEVVLTGIHLGAYGKDLDPETSLLALLQQISVKSDLQRIRLTSMEPREISEALIDFAATWKTFCPHFHIPLQSGDDLVLKRMKRPYDSTYFKALVHRIRSALPVASIGVDIMVGFPGETDRAYENTLSLIESLPVTYLHVFPFSSRQHTPAAQMPQQVDEQTKRKRCEVLRKLGVRKRAGFYRGFIGKTMKVLVETRRDGDGLLKGLSDNYIPLSFEGPDEFINRIVDVEMLEVTPGNRVFGQIREIPSGDLFIPNYRTPRLL